MEEEDRGGAQEVQSYGGQFLIQTLSSSAQTEEFKKPKVPFKTPSASSTMRISTPNGLQDSGMCASPQDLSPIERWSKSGTREASTSFESGLQEPSSLMDYILSSPSIQADIRTTDSCSPWGQSSRASSSGYYSMPSSSAYFSMDNSSFSVLPEGLQADRKDILKTLYRSGNYRHIISHILSYLSPQDLAYSQLVSKTWNRLVSEDRSSRDRLASYLQDKEYSENLGLEKKKRSHVKRSVFFDISNESCLPPSPTKESVSNLSNFEKFLKERNNCGPGDTLRRCPKCQSPSHVSRRTAKCTQCKLDFCLVCYMDRTTSFHDTMCRSAAQRIASPTKVVSKANKRRLRRLASLKL